MHTSVAFTRLPSLADLTPLRERYLSQLAKAQDALLEVLVADAVYFRIDGAQEPLGYFIVHGGDKLVEFYLTPSGEPFALEIFPQIVEEQAIASALVKSFDALFLGCALDLNTRVEVRGFLGREYVRRELPALNGAAYTQRTAELRDLLRIRAVKQEVFTHPERLREAVERGQVRLFELDGALLGFGIIRPVVPGRPDVEIGLSVDVPYRQHGYAMHMLQDMVEHCRSLGLNPIAGCSAQNQGSWRAGLRVGYLPRHRLLEVRFR